MECKFCHKDTKLVKSHVIPEGFFRRLREGQLPPKVLHEKDFPKRAPIGVYDKNILCLECEKIFGDWDNHAQQILAESPNGNPIEHEGKIVAYEVSDFDYSNLKLFFISLLWRASISTHPFYGKINLGPYEQIAKSHIERSNPGTDSEFAVTISKFDEHPFELATLDPHREKCEGVNYCRFYLAGYIVYIKADKRSAPPPHDKIHLKAAGPLIIICRNLSKSKELPIIYKLGDSANQLLKRTG